jgi:hypothetical protein
VAFISKATNNIASTPTRKYRMMKATPVQPPFLGTLTFNYYILLLHLMIMAKMQIFMQAGKIIYGAVIFANQHLSCASNCCYVRKKMC